jgi:hypothetical protein
MYATAVVVTCFLFASIFTIVFQCRPVQAAWDFTILERKCITFPYFLYASGVIGLITDFVLVVFPIPLFWKLQLPMRQKLILTFLFGVGSM